MSQTDAANGMGRKRTSMMPRIQIAD